MTARDRDRPSADDHARARRQPAANTLAQREGHLAFGAVLAQRRHPRVQQRARVLGRLQQQDVVVFLRDVVAQRAVARRDQMRVRVDESRQDRGRAVVPLLHGGAAGGMDVGGAAEAGHAVTVDQQRRLLDGRASAAVEEARRREQRVARRWRGHAVRRE